MLTVPLLPSPMSSDILFEENRKSRAGFPPLFFLTRELFSGCRGPTGACCRVVVEKNLFFFASAIDIAIKLIYN